MTQVPGETRAAARGPIGVLLVDDQPFVAIAVRRLLADESDLQLHCCHQATAAIGIANDVQPDVILQDLVMPDIDGLTLVGLYRRNPATATTPVIVLSGDDASDLRVRAAEAGANDYLVKLPSRADLISCIRRHVVPAAGAAAPAPTASLCVATLNDLLAGADACPTFAIGLIDQFLGEAGTLVRGLADAADRHDLVSLKASAHKLKGSALIMGAKPLAARCATLEEVSAGRGDATGAVALSAAISDEFDRVRSAFDEAQQALRERAFPQGSRL